VARTPLTEDQVRAKALAYCERYGVSPGPAGLPPFPAGHRETRQHREWLAVYRALQRAKARATSAAVPSPSDGARACPICARAIGADDGVPVRPGGGGHPLDLHRACADLVRLAETAGPDALARLSHFLWPRAGRAGS
jgi:hypothetical protein